MDELLPAVLSSSDDSDDLREPIRPVLERLADKPELVDPTEHVLGFVHCRLGETAGRVIRLHIWSVPPLNAAEPEWLIHNHLWEIRSHILCGQLEDHRFNVSTVPEGPHRLYEVHYEGARSRRVASNRRVDCHLVEKNQWSAGDRYVIPPGDFHTTVVDPGVLTATLVVTGIPSPERPLVVGSVSGQGAYDYERRAYPSDSFSAAVSDVLGELNS
jgi:hypothetical protein